MKKRSSQSIKTVILAGVLLVLAALLFVIAGMLLKHTCAGESAPLPTQEPIYTPAPTPVDIYAYYDWTEMTEIRVYDHRADKLITMPLEEYVIGVASGEMPVRYEFEALKAQAVATRT